MNDSCEYISHCLGKKKELFDVVCLTDNHCECQYYQLLENRKRGSIADKL